MVKLIHSNQAVIKGLNPKLLDRITEGRMRADQYLIVSCQKAAYRIRLTALAGTVTQIPFGLDVPISPEAEFRQRLVSKAGANGLFGYGDNRLTQPLVKQFIQRDKHQRPALTRGRWRLDQQILLTTVLIGALLHRAHTQLVGLIGLTALCVRYRYRRDMFIHTLRLNF